MQVRHIEHAQLDLAKAEKAELEQPPPALLSADGEPWDELLEGLALLAALHAAPCRATRERDDQDEKDRPKPKEDEPEGPR